jgi:hypothetical protein
VGRKRYDPTAQERNATEKKTMNIDIDLSWPAVRHKRFEIIVNMFDYVCDSWANAIVYRDRQTDQRLGFVTRDGEFRVRPEFCPS